MIELLGKSAVILENWIMMMNGDWIMTLTDDERQGEEEVPRDGGTRQDSF